MSRALGWGACRSRRRSPQVERTQMASARSAAATSRRRSQIGHEIVPPAPTARWRYPRTAKPGVEGGQRSSVAALWADERAAGFLGGVHRARVGSRCGRQRLQSATSSATRGARRRERARRPVTALLSHALRDVRRAQEPRERGDGGSRGRASPAATQSLATVIQETMSVPSSDPSAVLDPELPPGEDHADPRDAEPVDDMISIRHGVHDQVGALADLDAPRSGRPARRVAAVERRGGDGPSTERPASRHANQRAAPMLSVGQEPGFEIVATTTGTPASTRRARRPPLAHEKNAAPAGAPRTCRPSPSPRAPRRGVLEMVRRSGPRAAARRAEPSSASWSAWRRTPRPSDRGRSSTAAPRRE